MELHDLAQHFNITKKQTLFILILQSSKKHNKLIVTSWISLGTSDLTCRAYTPTNITHSH